LNFAELPEARQERFCRLKANSGGGIILRQAVGKRLTVDIQRLRGLPSGLNCERVDEASKLASHTK